MNRIHDGIDLWVQLSTDHKKLKVEPLLRDEGAK